jgi:hypothetical protein
MAAELMHLHSLETNQTIHKAEWNKSHNFLSVSASALHALLECTDKYH